MIELVVHGIGFSFMKLKSRFFKRYLLYSGLLCFLYFDSLPLLAKSLCRPFQFYYQLQIPTNFDLNQFSSAPQSVEELLNAISRIPFHENFKLRFYETNIQTELGIKEQDVLPFLTCIYNYVSQDHDGDFIPDWSALNNQRLSPQLLPLDSDIDGDGISNIFDGEPFLKKLSNHEQDLLEIPAHLKMVDPVTPMEEVKISTTSKNQSLTRSHLQEKLWREYSVLVLDYTDQHSLSVLIELQKILEHSGSVLKFKPNDYRVIYAFKGHDPKFNIAAYHRDIKAISIGGRSAYGDGTLNMTERVNLVAALTHEFGHDFLFSRLSGQELKAISEKFGNWNVNLHDQVVLSLDAPAFFLPYPFSGDKQLSEMDRFHPRQMFNFTSRYAYTNIHEWFADAFAGWMIQKLGRAGVFGDQWQSALISFPDNPLEYWTNYLNLSDDFIAWFDEKVSI